MILHTQKLNGKKLTKLTVKNCQSYALKGGRFVPDTQKSAKTRPYPVISYSQVFGDPFIC